MPRPDKNTSVAQHIMIVRIEEKVREARLKAREWNLATDQQFLNAIKDIEKLIAKKKFADAEKLSKRLESILRERRDATKRRRR